VNLIPILHMGGALGGVLQDHGQQGWNLPLALAHQPNKALDRLVGLSADADENNRSDS
jgi:hypothetical protein